MSTIDELRGLNDFLHHLYKTVPPQLSSMSDQIGTIDGSLAQCMAEIRDLETIVKSENCPLNEADLTNALDNLTRTKATLDVYNR
jgi:hypothetical protein